MAKRKKYPRLPNGFGSIKYLGKKRRNPYAVHPPAAFNDAGVYVTPKAICYVDDWLKGFAVLTSYKAGTYKQGDECKLANTSNDIAQTLLANYNQLVNTEAEKGMTFAEVYDRYYYYKYERDGHRNYAENTKATTRTCYGNCASLFDRTFSTLRHDDLQDIIDNSSLSYSSLQHIISFLKQLYEYAITKEIIPQNKNYALGIKINIENGVIHGEPFTEDDLEILWKNKEDEIVEMILIMCYSGYRVSAYYEMDINIGKKYFKGGVKNKTSKDRKVPIHSAIFPLVKKRLSRGAFFDYNLQAFRAAMVETLNRLNIKKHTPHDTRHTFSMLCEKYEVKENDRKRMLGHAFADITNKVYGHRTVEDLRKEIEKIKICY